jgi:hypothetical protein
MVQPTSPQQTWQNLDTFFIPYTSTLSLNWPFDPKECLILAPATSRSPLSGPSGATNNGPSSNANTASAPPEEQQWLLSQAFENHLRDLNNWSLGSRFKNAFPNFTDLTRIKED